jgi:hypothetical protein
VLRSLAPQFVQDFLWAPKHASTSFFPFGCTIGFRFVFVVYEDGDVLCEGVQASNAGASNRNKIEGFAEGWAFSTRQVGADLAPPFRNTGLEDFKALGSRDHGFAPAFAQ